MGLFAAVIGAMGVAFCWGMFTDWRHDRRPRTGWARRDRTRWRGETDEAGCPSRDTGTQTEGTEPLSFEALFSAADRGELEVAFTQAEQEELARLRERASEAAARLRSSAVPVHEVCSTGAGPRAQTLRVRFADGTTVVLCCRGSSGSYWVQALRRQILSGGVLLDRMTFGLAGPVVVFATPVGEVFVMAELVTIGS